MKIQSIMAAALFGLLTACWQRSLVTFYLTCLGCMLMYAFRMFSLSVSGRGHFTNDSGAERPAAPLRPFASLQMRRRELSNPANPD
jgi:hypothetical protein